MIFLGSLEDCTDPLLELPIVCSLPSTTHDILPLTYQQIPFQLNPLFPNADLSVLRLENPTVSAAPGNFYFQKQVNFLLFQNIFHIL